MGIGFNQKNPKQSSILWIILAVAVVGFAGWSFISSDLEHIEDTNGADNYELTIITDENIINQDMGALNFKKASSMLNDSVTFSSDKFTGVAVICRTTFIFPSTFDIQLTNFHVNEGNFKMAVVNNDKIIAEIKPDMFAECRLDGLMGDTRLVMAGESADFEFYVDGWFCEQYNIRASD